MSLCLLKAIDSTYNYIYTVEVIFEWDENKRQQNRRIHKIDFEDVPSMFAKPMLVRLDEREDYDEERWIGLGLLHNFVVVVVYVEHPDDMIRIISARKATGHERRQYEKG